MLPRSLQQALPQDNQLILLSDIQAFSDHKAGHTISSPLGGRELGVERRKEGGRKELKMMAKFLISTTYDSTIF